MKPHVVDYLAIGSGLAGLTFALKAARHGTVAVLTKADMFESNTSYAQGGIAAAVGETDSWELHEEDTLIAGAGLCDRQAVRFLVQRAPAAIEWLVSLGAHFDMVLGDDQTPQLALGREGGHSRNRIIHHADNTGWEVERVMTSAVSRAKGIEVYENCFATQLLMRDGRCVGARAQIDEAGPRTFLARAVVIATGGCGRMYRHTTNPRVATGDGIALADAVGATIEGMEFMQFHPTTLYHQQKRGFLITEAVRGLGGILRNHEGTRFMYEYDDRLELAPRDIVARAITAEMKRLNTWCVYLDMTHLKPDEIDRHFPNIVAQLKTVGIEPHKNWIPVVPAQHYSCGGVKTDLNARTNVPGLYAVGEVASTGVHGANRLASNSLLEGLVFGDAAAAAAQEEPSPAGEFDPEADRHYVLEGEAVRLRRSLQQAMTDFVGIVRTNEGLNQAQTRVEQLLAEHAALPAAPFARYSAETANLLMAARHVVRGARARRENIGLHYNVDLS